MCILCKNKKTNIPKVDIEAIKQSNIDRNGLSNIYNINNDLTVCNEKFVNPTYYMDGAIIPTTGTTTGCTGVVTAATYSFSACTAVYNLSEIDDFNLTFNLTGNTQYTGYTGSFCYHTFSVSDLSKNRSFVTKRDSALSDCFIYSAITGNTIVETINIGDLPLKDEQYFIKDYNIFTTKNCEDKLRINTFDLTTQELNLPNSNWYFVTVTNPDRPILGSNGDANLLSESLLKTEIPILEEGQTTVFRVQGVPLNNQMVVYVNGVQLQQGADWEPIIDKVGFINLLKGSVNVNLDTITVTYLALSNEVDKSNIFNLNESFIQTDSFIVSTITSGITSGVTTPTLNYNPTRNRQEVLLTKTMDPLSDILFVVNGVTLVENTDYFKSRSNNSRIIMSPTSVLKIGDSISVFYITEETVNNTIDLGLYRTLTPSIVWRVPFTYTQIPSDRGVFLVQVTTKDDIDFQTPLEATYVDFNTIDDTYQLQLQELPTNQGEIFIVRVCFFKDYPILFDNIITTRVFSDIGTLRVNLAYSENSY